MRPEDRGSISARLVLGLAVIALGVLFTLDNLHVLDADRFIRFWPALLVVVGLVKLFDPARPAGRLAGAALVLIGGVILFDEIPGIYLDLDLGDLWPLILLVAGGWLVWTALSSRRRGPGEASSRDDGSRVQAFAMMSGNVLSCASQRFRGGDLGAIMGGVELDLRGASIEGDRAELDLFAMWGGVEIHVPESWAVTSKVQPLLGAFEDKTRPPLDPDAPRLVVRGVVLMGGAEIDNKPGSDS